MKTLYKIAHRVSRAAGWKRLEAWSYLKWFRWWIDRDPALGYWKFADEFLGAR